MEAKQKLKTAGQVLLSGADFMTCQVTRLEGRRCRPTKKNADRSECLFRKLILEESGSKRVLK